VRDVAHVEGGWELALKTDERGDERARRRWGRAGAKDNERRRPGDLLFEAAAGGGGEKRDARSSVGWLSRGEST